MIADTKSKLYKTQTILKRRLRVAYPPDKGRMVLRTEQDWDKDVAPIETSEDGTIWTFELEADQPFLYFKPCLVRDDEFHWSVGPNKLLLMEETIRGFPIPTSLAQTKGLSQSWLRFPRRFSIAFIE